MRRIILILAAAVLSVGTISAQKLTILHTNDTHSHIDPIRAGEMNGDGGVIERAAYIDSVRAAVGRKNLLLVDAGDFSQGSSYFTMLGGDLEVDLINAMKYDVVCLGNHEFDNGIDEIIRRVKNLRCPVVCANYDFEGSALSKVVKPWTIVRKGGLKIGVIGLLTDVTRVVEREIADKLKYMDPVEVTNRYAAWLKDVKKCDMVICLSHLGYDADIQLAGQSCNVDVIVGGHSHTFLEAAETHADAEGKPVTVVTDGCWGLFVGKLEVY